MACQKNADKVAEQPGPKSGITSGSSKSGFVAGVTARVAGLVSKLRPNPKKRKRQKPNGATPSKQKAVKAGKKRNGKPSTEATTVKTAKKQKAGQAKKQANGKPGAVLKEGQVSVFTSTSTGKALKPLSPTQGSRGGLASADKPVTRRPDGPQRDEKKALPTPRQIKVAGVFPDKELQSLSVQFRLDAAATRRHIRELGSGTSRGIGHSDPRPGDWAKSDLKNYDFLAGQIGEVRRGQDHLDVSSLSRNDLVDLWDFSRHETDRSLRFIDHLQVGGSHLKGETATYLTDKYRLKGRFCGYLSKQLEPMITTEMIAEYERGD